MNFPNFIRSPYRMIQKGLAALLVTGYLFAGSAAGAAPTTPETSVGPTVKNWKFTPSLVCNPDALLRYVVSTSLRHGKGAIAEDSQGVVVCDMAARDNDAIRTVLGYKAADADRIPLYYIAASHSTKQDGDVSQQKTTEFLKNTKGVPAGVYISSNGMPTSVGESIPPPDLGGTAQVKRILALASEDRSLNLSLSTPVEPPPVVIVSTIPDVVMPQPDWISHRRGGVTYASLRPGSRDHRINNIEVHPGNRMFAQVTVLYRHQHMTAQIDVANNNARVSSLSGGSRALFAEWLARRGIDEVHQAGNDILTQDGHGAAVAKVAQDQVNIAFNEPVRFEQPVAVTAEAMTQGSPIVFKAAPAPIDIHSWQPSGYKIDHFLITPAAWNAGTIPPSVVCPSTSVKDSDPSKELIECFKAAKKIVAQYRKQGATEDQLRESLNEIAKILPAAFETDAVLAFKAARYVFNMRAKELGARDDTLLRNIHQSFDAIHEKSRILAQQSARFILRNAKGMEGKELRGDARKNLQRSEPSLQL